MVGRVRGFADWRPQAHVLKLVETVNGILEENADILPLTIRQVFYMLVSNHGYEKTEHAYKRLIEALNRARRARLVSMDALRDDGLARRDQHCYEGSEHFLDAVRGSAGRLQLPRQRGQDQFVIVWCEAGGMLPQLARYCLPYGVPVLSSGGFDSLTSKHSFAVEIARLCDEHEGGVVIKHIGDHDPSGVHMCSSLTEDLWAFSGHYGGSVAVDRVAVTPEQVRDMRLPTAPPKKTDRRSFDGNETTQAEAIPPAALRQIITGHIELDIDLELLNDLKKQELEIREELRTKLEGL